MDFKKPHFLVSFFKSYQFANVVLFYIVWYLCILGASFHYEKSAVSISAVLILVHYYFSKVRLLDFIFLIVFLAIGLSADLTSLHYGIISYPVDPDSWRFLGVPAWVLMLYVGFSTTINHSLSFVKKYPWLSGVFGGFGSAVCYWFASFRGIIYFPDGFLSLVYVGVYWGLLMVIAKPLSQFASKRFH